MKHIVGFSGGIDSQACARWVLNRYPAEDVVLLNTDAGGNEHELTKNFIGEYHNAIHPVILVTPMTEDIERSSVRRDTEAIIGEGPLTFLSMARGVGIFPTNRNQFCTSYLKLSPLRRWHREHTSDVEFERYTGVRRDESRSRSDTPIRAWDDYFDCYVNNPLADWTKQMCFDYVKAHGEPINPLYSMGFSRVGCAPCVNANKDDVKQWAARFPEVIDKVRAWETQVGRTFFPPLLPNITPRMHGGELKRFNWIDEVVEWARTDRGGRQFNIFNNLERPACESKFGLCE